MARRVTMGMVRSAARAKAEGVYARKLGMARGTNPYLKKGLPSATRESWFEGWDETNAEIVRDGGPDLKVRGLGQAIAAYRKAREAL